MKYRVEIDGLRAIAVVPVILFHAGFKLFSGGFIGVDVFFVISGYLITTILIEDIENNRFSIVNFYERRARRILPALFFVILVCIPFAWLWMTPNQFKDFSQSIIAVSLFVSNILFWKESGYFAAEAEEKPLLHTWSLAVEEQYYVLFPIFLFLAWRFGKNRVFWMIVVFSALSLALSEWAWRYKETANFYLAPTRAWELFAGSIAAFSVQKYEVKNNNFLSLLGLASITFSIFAYDENTPFPSIYALIPVMGVMLIIQFAGNKTLAAKLLSTKVLVGIGTISYSAYLWHQPLFSFARIRLIEQPSILLMGVLSLLSILLAIFSWHLIERPYRNKNRFTKFTIFYSAFVSVLAFTAFGLISYKKNGYDYRYNQDQMNILAYDNYHIESIYRTGSCFLKEDQTFNDFDAECFHNGGYLVWGDSHAAALASGLNILQKNISQLTTGGCPPILNTYIEVPKRPNCTSINNNIFNFLKNNPSFEILLHADWLLYDIDYENELPNTLDLLIMNGIDKITIIGGVPHYKPTLPRILLQNRIKLDKENMSPNNNKDVAKIDSVIQAIARRYNVKFMSALDAFCDNVSCLNVILSNDKYVLTTWDEAHLTLEGSLFLNNYLFKSRSSL